jgi:uncharacterized tellurite resistance protein B-like protein
MDHSPESLRELAQYLRNTTRLFPNPRARKAYEWLMIKAEEADDLAEAWESDRKKLRALRRVVQEHFAIEDSGIDELLANYSSAHDEGEVIDGIQPN